MREEINCRFRQSCVAKSPQPSKSTFLAAIIKGLASLAPLVCLFKHDPGLAQDRFAVVPTLPPVVVNAPRDTNASSITDAPLGVTKSWRFDAADLQGTVSERIDDFLSRRGVASTNAASSLGLAPSLALRGFAVSAQGAPGLTASRLYLNGHADVAYRFVRDMSTVESVEVMSGFDATLLGVGSRGGTLQFFSKQPSGKNRTTAVLTAATDGLLRTTVDIEKNLGPMQLRAVLAAQTGQYTAEQAPTRKENYLFSLAVPSAIGDFRLDFERQANHAPFVFGTVYAAGRFEYDKPYVSPQSQALRIYERQALYWKKQLSPQTQVSISAQQAQVHRRETLVGFWDVKNTSQLNGYWRELDASAQQKDVDLRLESALTLAGFKHHLSVAAQLHQQTLDFSGPQSISQYVISIAKPVWPINLSALTLRPRTLQERYQESGLAATDRIELAEGLDIRLGVRRSSIDITTASDSPVPKTAAKFAHTTLSGALAWQMSSDYKIWLAQTASFEPNRGLLRDGSFLPPQNGRQTDAGVAFSKGIQRWSASVFNIEQTNLPNTDPLDKNFIVPAGTARVSGVAISAGFQYAAVKVDVNTSFQRARVNNLISPALGNLFVGQPQWQGGARIEGQINGSSTWWINPQWQGKRPADVNGAVFAPAFIRWDAGMQHQLAPNSTLAVQLDNIADKRYVQAISSVDNVWQGPRRRLLVQLTQNF